MIKAYETTIGVMIDMQRRDFITAAALTTFVPSLIGELVASISMRDSHPLLTVQTTYADDMGLATSNLDRPSFQTLRSWMDDGSSAVLRVNATGVLAKVPGQPYARVVIDTLNRDVEVQERYLTAVTARVLGLEWNRARYVVKDPGTHPQPLVAASRFARESQNERDAGARWCAATMLQKLSPVLGTGPET